MRVNDIIDVLDRLSPQSAALDWDNVGLMEGDGDAVVKRILVTLDVDEASINKAVETGADMIVSHHPLIFNRIDRVTADCLTGRRLLALIRNGIACFSMHTNFDICGSMGDAAANTLGLSDTRTLEEVMPDGSGLGKIADFYGSDVIKAGQWAERVKKAFGLETVKIFGGLDKDVHRLALYPGSGSGAVDIALRKKSDILITGDIGHHSGIDAAARGLTIIDAGHYGIEHVFISYISDYIRKKLPELDVVEMDINNPFKVI